MSERDPRAPDVEIYEVGPRDGLQNEAEFVPTNSKLELIALLTASGLRRIEVASFVSPSWIPQLADGDERVAALPRSSGVAYGALVPNEKGYERFRAAGPIDLLGKFISASGTHNQKNANCSISEQLERLASELVIDAIVPPESLRDEIAARLASAEGSRDAPPAKWRSVTPV